MCRWGHGEDHAVWLLKIFIWVFNVMIKIKASTTNLGRDLNAFLFVQDLYEMIPHSELVHIFFHRGLRKKANYLWTPEG